MRGGRGRLRSLCYREWGGMGIGEGIKCENEEELASDHVAVEGGLNLNATNLCIVLSIEVALRRMKNIFKCFLEVLWNDAAELKSSIFLFYTY